MAKKGQAGKARFVLSEWVDVDDDQFWVTVIAAAGWSLAILFAWELYG